MHQIARTVSVLTASIWYVHSQDQRRNLTDRIVIIFNKWFCIKLRQTIAVSHLIDTSNVSVYILYRTPHTVAVTFQI